MQQGISLIELLIVLAVIGMLAAVALPAYDEPLKRAARTEVVGLLHDVALRLEQHRLRHGRYDEPPPDAPWPVGSRHYRLVVRHDAATYRLTAERVPGGRLSQDPCGDFQLDQAGRRGNPRRASAGGGLLGQLKTASKGAMAYLDGWNVR